MASSFKTGFIAVNQQFSNCGTREAALVVERKIKNKC